MQWCRIGGDSVILILSMSQTYGNSVLRGGVVCTLTLVPKYVWTHARKLRIKGFIKGLKALLKLPLLRKKKIYCTVRVCLTLWVVNMRSGALFLLYAKLPPPPKRYWGYHSRIRRKGKCASNDNWYPYLFIYLITYFQD